MASSTQPGFMVQTPHPNIFNDYSVQGPFVSRMSSSLSQAISRTGMDPLRSTIGRWEYGLGGGGGGARSLDSILSFPAEVPTATNTVRRWRKTTKRRKTTKKTQRRKTGAGRSAKKTTRGAGGKRRKKRRKATRKTTARGRGGGRKCMKK